MVFYGVWLAEVLWFLVLRLVGRQLLVIRVNFFLELFKVQSFVLNFLSRIQYFFLAFVCIVFRVKLMRIKISYVSTVFLGFYRWFLEGEEEYVLIIYVCVRSYFKIFWLKIVVVLLYYVILWVRSLGRLVGLFFGIIWYD